jgi:WD40 repeat protein
MIQPVKADGDITLADCSTNPIFKVTKKQPKPDKIEKGESVKILVAGKMLQKEHVKELHIVANLDGKKIFENTEAKDADVEEGGIWRFDYSTDVPTFVPPGQWVTELRLKNDKGEELCCISASWKI